MISDPRLHTVLDVLVGDGAGPEEEGTEEEVREYHPGEQRPMELDRWKYLQPGRLSLGFGPDKLPVIQGELPDGPEPGVTDDNFICLGAPGRPPCEHLRAVLTNAPGVARGFQKMRAVRRFCMAMATASELYDLDGIDVFACLSRRPVDEASLALIEDFERRQKEHAAESAQTRDEMEW